MDFDANRAIWTQLVEEFTRRIATGAWAPGERVPSVRELAAELGVNPNTVQRSLAELETTGLAETQRTSGRYVTADQVLIARRRRDLADAAAADYVDAVRRLQLSESDARDLVTERWNTTKESLDA